VSKIRGFPSLHDGFERECTEVFRERRPELGRRSLDVRLDCGCL